VGRDVPNTVNSVGKYCQEHACCDVLTVAGPEFLLQPAGGVDVTSPDKS
jgi:hypothetical protein